MDEKFIESQVDSLKEAIYNAPIPADAPQFQFLKDKDGNILMFNCYNGGAWTLKTNGYTFCWKKLRTEDRQIPIEGMTSTRNLFESHDVISNFKNMSEIDSLPV